MRGTTNRKTKGGRPTLMMRRRRFRKTYVEYWDEKNKIGVYAMHIAVPSPIWIFRVFTDKDFSARAFALERCESKVEADKKLKEFLKNFSSPEELRRFYESIKKKSEKIEKEKEKIIRETFL